MINLTKKLLIQALDQCASGTLVVDARDPRSPIIYANNAFTDLTGRDAKGLVGKSLKEMLVSGELPSATLDEVEQRWRTRTATPVTLKLRVAPLAPRPGVPDYWLLTHPGPAAGRSRTADDPARTDALTGLPNRMVFDEVLSRDWGIARRDGRSLALILFEIDAMDRYREVFGRHASEACLRKVGHAIGGALRRCGDLAARVGDNRFAALAGEGSVDDVARFADSIAARVRDLAIHHPRSPVARFVTVSVGVAAMVPTGDAPFEQLLEQADEDLQARREEPFWEASG